MSSSSQSLAALRAKIRRYTHADETTCVEGLLAASQLSERQRSNIVAKGRELVAGCREDVDRAGMLDRFMQEYSLSSKEGVALMCLAESLLRVPDAETADQLIAEKILSGDWGEHLGHSESLFVNASTWGLMLTGRMVSLEPEITEHTTSWMRKLVNRLGEPLVRGAVRQAMKIMGEQYILGREISDAIQRGRAENTPTTRFSFDMLGEGARTIQDARRYFNAYLNAIREIGKAETQDNVIAANGISVKLSALHPRYQYAQQQRVRDELLPLVKDLAGEAKRFGLGFTLDAEEADRLDISLTIFQALALDPELAGWDGLGFVLQAYGKRSPYLADWLVALARVAERKIMVRLVKGAYWDSEIKYAQEQGYRDYPVYTRKANTDLSYQVCAVKLLEAQDAIYPQFATHNAYTAALILEIAGEGEFEFQRLHGMGELLYGQLAKQTAGSAAPLRVYAPVGAHRDLLPYLVRRLLENGANSSFVNRFLDKKVPVAELISDVRHDVESSVHKRHPNIPLPAELLSEAGDPRPNTHGIDLANPGAVEKLQSVVEPTIQRARQAGPIIGGKINTDNGAPIYSPADKRILVGNCRDASAEDASRALDLADLAQPAWHALGGEKRAAVLDRAADKLEATMEELTGLISLEAGRTLNDGIAEVREAADFLRYYANLARQAFSGGKTIAGPAGEACEYSLQGRGVFFCISPWNFPLAIFVGQVAAALAAGNAVIAKPADTTPLIAAEAVSILHEAGVPGDVLHLLPGKGRLLGGILNSDPRISGVAFTGSTEVALGIHDTLLSRGTEVPLLIAETGGQNAMVVDSTSLPEQVVDDAIRSAFLSAGQRCSALRVMYVQEEIADDLIRMLKGAMRELVIGEPWKLATDVGPVIDDSARRGLLGHIENMKNSAILHYACELGVDTERGTFVAPHLFELQSVNELPGEVFGPVLHVIRYRKAQFDRLIDEINGTGYGLTLGVHSRIESFAKLIVERTRVGNNYINRNMVGAVPGVNPFGGQGLSGTGPKAGGPNYLVRFARQQIISSAAAQHNPAEHDGGDISAIINGDEIAAVNHLHITSAIDAAVSYQSVWDCLSGEKRALLLDAAAVLLEQRIADVGAIVSCVRYYADQARQKCESPLRLPGPTGEINELSLHGRGVFLCAAADGASSADWIQQLAAALAAGNAVIAAPAISNAALPKTVVQAMLDAGVPKQILHFIPGKQTCELAIRDGRLAGIAWRGPTKTALAMQTGLARHSGAITPMVTEPGGPDYLLRFVVEKTKTVNTVATGGNAWLLNLLERA